MKQFESVQKVSLYPERVIDRIDGQLDVIEGIEKGLIKPMQFTELEKKDILGFENSIGDRLEKIADITTQKVSFYMEYFLTQEGRENFEKNVGVALSETEDVNVIINEIFTHRDALTNVSYDNVKKLEGLSVAYYDEQLLKKLNETVDDRGMIDVEDVKDPQGIDVLLTPEKLAGKIAELIAFKNDVKKLQASLNDNNSVDHAKKRIIELYRRKYNQMLSECYFDSSLIAEMIKHVDDTVLTEEEKELLNMQVGMNNVRKNLSRRDKFIHGASVDYVDGERVQISEMLRNYAEQVAAEHEKNDVEKNEKIIAFGYDPEKIFAKNVTSEDVAALVNELLDMYDLKSAYGPETYDAKRSGSAADGRWQFIAKDTYKSMSVNGKQKVIKSDTKNKDIYHTMTVALGHEIGHVFQSINSTKIPLRLFKKLKGDRSSVFAEGGAMMLQDHIAREIFGTGALGHSHYVRAMITKIEGGSYLDCVKTFYESSMHAVQQKRDAEHMTEDQYAQLVREKLQIAINRAKRLFRHSINLDSSSTDLTKSKDTAYLEQVMLAKKMQERGLEKYLFFSGMNLTTLSTLLEMGLINAEDIHVPKDHVFTIWDRMKEQFILDKKDDNIGESLLES